MAAHVVTGMKELVEDLQKIEASIKMTRDKYQAALDLSCFTEDLELDDYGEMQMELDDLGSNISSMRAWVEAMVEKYTIVWSKLGMPSNREDWRKASWAEFLKRYPAEAAKTDAEIAWERACRESRDRSGLECAVLVDCATCGQALPCYQPPCPQASADAQIRWEEHQRVSNL